MKSEIEMKVNIKDVENHIKQLEEQCEDWKSDHEHNLKLMKGLNNRISELEHQIEKMRCGQNCKHLYINLCDLNFRTCSNCKDKWEIKEK